MNLIYSLNNIYKYLTKPDYRFLFWARYGRYNSMPDEEYLKRMFKATIGNELDLQNPKTFNEKIQWLKLNDRNPLYTILVDKYKVKKYVANIIGEEYIIPTLGVWEDPESIDFNQLPKQFVLKCNHNSGTGMYICKDKSLLNSAKVKAALKKGLEQNYYLTGREWPYKNVERRIIAEKYINSVSGQELIDYKFMCFNGEVKCSFVCTDRFDKSGLKVTFYDREWKMMPFERHYPRSLQPISKPFMYGRMIELAEKLSRNLPFARIDLYEEQKNLFWRNNSISWFWI